MTLTKFHSSSLIAHHHGVCCQQVQESSDSCDSETTVTSHAGDATTPLVTDTATATFELDTQAQVLETHSEVEEERVAKEEEKEEVPGYNVHQFSRLAEATVEPCVTGTTTQSSAEAQPEAESGVSLELSAPVETPASELGSSMEPSLSAEQESTADVVGESAPGSTKDSNSGLEGDSSMMGQPSPEASAAASADGAGEVGGVGGLSPSDRVHIALHRAKERSASVCDERAGQAGQSRAQELRKARLSRNPLQRSSSLPTSLLTPSRVVSSLRIQLGHGSIRHCTTPTFSYRYTPDLEGALEVGSIKEEDNSDENEEGTEQGRPSCQTTLIINPRGPGDQGSGSGVTDLPFPRVPPYPPAMPSHLTLSSTSLYSGPHDWTPHRSLAEGGGWSSVPNLTMTQGHAPSPSPLHTLHPHSHHHHHHLPQFRSPYPAGAAGSPHTSLYSSFNSALLQTPASCLTPSPTAFYSPPPSAYFTPPQGTGMFNNSALYGQMHGISPYGSPFHPQQQQMPQQQQQQQQQLQTQPDGRYSSPVPSYSSLVHPHSAPYSLPYSTPPPSRLGQPYHPQYSGPPCFPFPHEMAPQPPPQAPSSTEMQLRRVLHEIRGTVQNLSQVGAKCI